MVKIGDTLPSVPLQEGAPDKTVDLSKELKNGVVVGVPGKSLKFLSKQLEHEESNPIANSIIHYCPQC